MLDMLFQPDFRIDQIKAAFQVRKIIQGLLHIYFWDDGPMLRKDGADLKASDPFNESAGGNIAGHIIKMEKIQLKLMIVKIFHYKLPVHIHGRPNIP